MNTNPKELRLTNITRYNDVDLGSLVLTADGHMKSWKAIWQTNLHVNVNGASCVPCGNIPIKYKCYHQWIDCPRLRLNHRHFMWIIPLDCYNWVDMGVNLYLCADEGWPQPLPRRDYEQMCRVICELKVGFLTVEQPRKTFASSWFRHDVRMGQENFWD